MRLMNGSRIAALGSLGLVFILGNKGCDKAPPRATDGGSAACTPKECGPAPGAPNRMCADGSVAGPGACERDTQGKCGWTFRECPDAGPGGAAHDGGQPARDGGRPAHEAGSPAHDAGAPAHDAGGSPALDGGGKRCGTRGGVECIAGEFCNFEPNPDCGGTDKGGVCETTPQICQTIYKPVCGCDKRSYSNACGAHAAGISVQHEGLCTPDECTAAGGHVVYGTGGPAPECPAAEDSWSIGGGKDPVLCCLPKPRGKTCGGIASLSCDAGQFCNYETAAGGQGCDGTIADAGGVCEATPQACTQQQAPVCGCDRRSYGNPCEAHANGAAVLHDGACTEIDCAAIGGHVVDGIGPGPMCPAGEVRHTYIRYSNGMISDEGSDCCVPSH